MPFIKAKRQKSQTKNHSHWAETIVELAQYDGDVVLICPGRKKITIQWRVEGPTLDICIDDTVCANNWIGHDMEAAPKHKKSHVRKINQLCLSLPEKGYYC